MARVPLHLMIVFMMCLIWSLVTATASFADSHTIVVDHPILAAEEGLILGNGDLSVSVYQTGDHIIWRFGKGDVWDRRIDRSDDPKPLHINELAHGIEVEGWKCDPYGGGVVEATHGTGNPKRMKEVCQGAPPSYNKRPYPCPKPVGELALHLPIDLPGRKIVQRLAIEEAKLFVDYSWPSGVKLHLESFVPPKPNVLVVKWKVEKWNATTRMGERPPAWFSLYRWADPTIGVFAAWQSAEQRSDFRSLAENPTITPLTPPATKQHDNHWSIEQTFAADPTFPKGFRYWLTPFISDAVISPVDVKATKEARLHIMPKPSVFEGHLVVAAATTGDAGGPEETTKGIRLELGQAPETTIARWADENRKAAADFWSRSKLSIADSFWENLWYETLHLRRCAYRRGAVPPGLFLPSTVADYTLWHGDYHWNYNFQEPFWGDYTANHLELGDAYFDGLGFALPMGRKIAKDYYGCRGVFVQLMTYPILADEDTVGVAPMGRMAYMTGWAVNQYWWRYRNTLDNDWLRTTGYPVIRDCALFYTDFMKKRADGLYHVFPSNQGEDGFSGNAKDYTDRAQVMQYARNSLRIAILASQAIGVDKKLRAEWQDRLDHAAGDDGKPPFALTGLEKHCHDANVPEFGFGRPFHPQPEKFERRPLPELGWYFGQYPIGVLTSLRQGDFIADRDLPAFRQMIEAWRRPNGMIWAMSTANYGRVGAWTESLGVTAPMQEMMLQSWDGALRIFPAWPKCIDAQFENFRAEGAFLVSAAWSQGRVTTLMIHSERGSSCAIYSPWVSGIQVKDEAGTNIVVASDPYGRPQFQTTAGKNYRLQPR